MVSLIEELKKFCKVYGDNILEWGFMQGTKQYKDLNNKLGSGNWVFKTKTFEGLQGLLNTPGLTDIEKQHMIKRWSVNIRSQIHEELFKKQPNVEANPDKFNKDWDFKINNVSFDLKSTRIGRDFNDIRLSLINGQLPDTNRIKDLVNFYYSQQSGNWNRMGRYGEQPRLFLVEVPNDILKDDISLTKRIEEESLIQHYCQNFQHKPEQRWNNGPYWRILFIVENSDKTLKYIEC